MTKKVLLCGEGPTDYGNIKFGSMEWEEGPVQEIIRNSTNGDIEFTYATKSDVKNVRIQRTKVTGHGKKAWALCYIATQMGDIDNIICYVDADREHSSGRTVRDAQNRVNEVCNEIRNGFKRFSESKSQSSIPMVPLRMIESWLLADKDAFQKIYGNKPINPELPPQPELIWGNKNDPNSNHPKNYLQRVLEQYHAQGNRETFRSIAKYTDICELKRRCPISFEQFYGDIQVIL